MKQNVFPVFKIMQNPLANFFTTITNFHRTFLILPGLKPEAFMHALNPFLLVLLVIFI